MDLALTFLGHEYDQGCIATTSFHVVEPQDVEVSAWQEQTCNRPLLCTHRRFFQKSREMLVEVTPEVPKDLKTLEKDAKNSPTPELMNVWCRVQTAHATMFSKSSKSPKSAKWHETKTPMVVSGVMARGYRVVLEAPNLHICTMGFPFTLFASSFTPLQSWSEVKAFLADLDSQFTKSLPQRATFLLQPCYDLWPRLAPGRFPQQNTLCAHLTRDLHASLSSTERRALGDLDVLQMLHKLIETFPDTLTDLAKPSCGKPGVMVLGKTGTGKSTLCGLMLGLDLNLDLEPVNKASKFAKLTYAQFPDECLQDRPSIGHTISDTKGARRFTSDFTEFEYIDCGGTLSTAKQEADLANAVAIWLTYQRVLPHALVLVLPPHVFREARCQTLVELSQTLNRSFANVNDEIWESLFFVVNDTRNTRSRQEQNFEEEEANCRDGLLHAIHVLEDSVRETLHSMSVHTTDLDVNQLFRQFSISLPLGQEYASTVAHVMQDMQSRHALQCILNTNNILVADLSFQPAQTRVRLETMLQRATKKPLHFFQPEYLYEERITQLPLKFITLLSALVSHFMRLRAQEKTAQHQSAHRKEIARLEQDTAPIWLDALTPNRPIVQRKAWEYLDAMATKYTFEYKGEAGPLSAVHASIPPGCTLAVDHNVPTGHYRAVYLPARNQENIVPHIELCVLTKDHPSTHTRLRELRFLQEEAEERVECAKKELNELQEMQDLLYNLLEALRPTNFATLAPATRDLFAEFLSTNKS